MKKIISLVLALMLSVTAVTAFASPTPQILEIDTEHTESKTEGITILGNLDKSKPLADLITAARKKTDNIGNIEIGKKIVFVNNAKDEIDNPELGKGMTNYAIAPFVQYSIDETAKTEENAKFLIPVSRIVMEFLLNNINNIRIFFIYEKGEVVFMYEVEEWYIINTSMTTYGLLMFIPMSVLQDAEGCPTCLDFEVIK